MERCVVYSNHCNELVWICIILNVLSTRAIFCVQVIKALLKAMMGATSPPELHIDALQHIYGFVSDLKDLVRCMAVCKDWQRAACTYSSISYDCPSVEDVREDEGRILSLLSFAARKNAEAPGQGSHLEHLSIKSQGTFSSVALGTALQAAGAQLKQLRFQQVSRHPAPENPLNPRWQECPCPSNSPPGDPLELFDLTSGSCPGLQVLEFSSNGRSTLLGTSLPAGSLLLSSMQSLSLSLVAFNTPAYFLSMLEAMPQLRVLALECIEVVGLDSVLLISCPALQELSVTVCPSCTALKTVQVTAPELRVLTTRSVGSCMDFPSNVEDYFSLSLTQVLTTVFHPAKSL